MSEATNYFNAFYAAESTLSDTTSTNFTGKAIYKFAPAYGTTRVPLHIRTGAQSFRQVPVERKRFDQIEFHGKGTLYVRIYVDGVWICDGTVTMTESPSKDRRLGIPTGTRGYTVDMEFCGDADIRAAEFTYRDMSSPS